MKFDYYAMLVGAGNLINVDAKWRAYSAIADLAQIESTDIAENSLPFDNGAFAQLIAIDAYRIKAIESATKHYKCECGASIPLDAIACEPCNTGDFPVDHPYHPGYSTYE